MTTEEQKRTRGRPRDPAIDRAILGAAYAVIAEHGFASATVRDIAMRANVPKSTIYRRFGSRRELLFASMREGLDRASPVPETGSLRGDLIELVRMQIEAINARDPLVMLALSADGDSELADVMQAFAVRRRDLSAQLLARARERGELKPGLDQERIIELISGYAWACFLGRFPLDEERARTTVDLLLAGIATDQGLRGL